MLTQFELFCVLAASLAQAAAAKQAFDEAVQALHASVTNIETALGLNGANETTFFTVKSIHESLAAIEHNLSH